MPRKDGDVTRNRILQIAEKLFSEKGYDGAGVNEIALLAGVNKATIYYHFKDKQDIIVSLFHNIMEEVDAHQQLQADKQKAEGSIRSKIKNEILFLETKKKILAVILMESLKDNKDDTLFFCAKTIMYQEIGNSEIKDKKVREAFSMHEFFTGFLPLISFVVYREKWCRYFNCSETTALNVFLDVFEKTHLNTHIIK
ncbi:MAG: TetR/AcrR family transcriptional regulator [Bacteroidetes bacterium]|nr:TetR/AcrR family transcriptional regulator [Bacteroidota bacterium]